MAGAHGVAPPTGDVEASIQFLVEDPRRPFNYMCPREDDGEQSHGSFGPHTVLVADGRRQAAELSLDRHGVMLVPHHTALSTKDFYDEPDRVWREYYAEMEALVQQRRCTSMASIGRSSLDAGNNKAKATALSMPRRLIATLFQMMMQNMKYCLWTVRRMRSMRRIEKFEKS